jgi:hypothetical protein
MVVKPADKADNIEESAFDVALEQLDRDALEKMRVAGETALEIKAVLAKTGDNVVGELLRDKGTFYEWNHYPDGDVYDKDSGSQFFYHAHPADLRVGEHGHFHTFMRPAGMPDHVSPAEVTDFEMPDDPTDALSHLIGISMNEAGEPICLFTTNRWVTGEIWYKGEDVIELTGMFEITHAQPSWPVNRWLNAMVRLYAFEIAALIKERDGVVEKWVPAPAEDGSAPTVFEDRTLEVTSYKMISVPDRVDRIRAVLG